VIDEIQRAPELLLAIKVAVDADQRPGRFLLTGSSRLLALHDLPDTLPGRMETVELWPFSQGEIDGTADSFIDTAFRLGPELRLETSVTRADYSERIVRGGLPVSGALLVLGLFAVTGSPPFGLFLSEFTILRAAVAADHLWVAATVLLLLAAPALAGDGPTRIGAVDTTFRLLGRNDRVVVDRYDDPRVDGVSCYVSRAETGGVSGSLGLATDPNRFSIACRATGPVTLKGKVPDKEIVFDEKMSAFFKEIRVSRLYDREKEVLVYLVWSTLSVGTNGSAFNSVTAVPLQAR